MNFGKSHGILFFRNLYIDGSDWETIFNSHIFKNVFPTCRSRFRIGDRSGSALHFGSQSSENHSFGVLEDDFSIFNFLPDSLAML